MDRATVQKKRLLLVDDSADFRELVMLYLKSMPIDIEEADDGTQALKMMTETRYDAILMDYKMPMMDGAEATKRFREWEEKVKRDRSQIIALSAFTRRQDQEELISAGCDEYLTKPIKRIDLIMALSLILKI